MSFSLMDGKNEEGEGAARKPPEFEIPGGWADRRFLAGERTLSLWVPADPEAFLNDPKTLETHGPSAENPARSDIPFWQYLWPAAERLAQLVARQDWSREGSASGESLTALELGAGVGLVGLAALAAGLAVTFSDYQQPALDAAASNARRNGFSRFDTLLLDWHRPAERRFPVILGSEVIYEQAIHRPILNVLDAMLAPGGVAWLADPGRSHVPAFLEEAVKRGYAVQIQDRAGRRLAAPRFGEFAVLILRREH